MGCCLSSKGKAELLIRQLKQETDVLRCVKDELIELDGNIRDVQKPEDMKKLELEYNQSISNVKRIAALFPHSYITLDQSLLDLEFSLPIARNYISNKLKISEVLKNLIIELDNVSKELKSIDANKNHISNSTIEALELLIKQESFTNLVSELQKVKQDQIELSNFRGGSLHNLLRRIESRCKISKCLETIQGKVESEQYIQNIENIVSNSEDLNEELADLVDKKKNNEELVLALRAKLQEKYKNEAEPIENKLAELEKKITNTQIEIKSRKSIKALKANKSEEIARLNVRYNYSESEINLLNLKYSELCKEFEVFSQISKAVSRTAKKVNTREINLKELMDELEKLKKEENAGFGVHEIDKDERTVQLDENINEVESVFSEIDKNIANTAIKRKASLQKHVILRLLQSIKESLEICLWKWKSQKFYRSIDNSITQHSYYLDNLDEEDFKAADKFISAQKEIIMNSDHCLMKFIDFQGIKPLETDKLFRFLEELMDKKYEVDLKDMNEGFLPMSFPDFVYNMILRIFGIQKSAERHISRVLMSLNQLYEENNQYAVFFCELFQVFTPDPIFYDFGIFLTRSRYDFQTIICNQEKKMLNQGQKTMKSIKKKQSDSLIRGGMASLSDTADLISCIFENNKALGVIALQKIKPASITLEEFITFLICQKVARLNISIENIFLTIDKDGSNTIDLKELTVFTRTSMDLWISESNLEACFLHLVKPGTKEIPKEVFVNTFSKDFFARANENEKYLVSKVEFMRMLVDIYNAEYRKEVAWVCALMSYYPEFVSKSEFTEIVIRIDSSFASQVETLYLDVTQMNGKVKKFDVICLILKKGIGNWKNSPFSMHEFINDLHERIDSSFKKSFMNYSGIDASGLSFDNSEIN